MIFFVTSSFLLLAVMRLVTSSGALVTRSLGPSDKEPRDV